MDLLETLLYQDRNQLIELLNIYDHLPCNRNSKREIIEELYPRLLTVESVNLLYNELSVNGKSLIMQCCFHDHSFFSKIELKAFLLGQDDKQFEFVLNEVQAIGWLYQTNDGYVIPYQLKEQIKQVCLTPLKETELFVSESDSDAVLTFCDDLIVFIDYIAEKAIPLTKSGVLHKRDFQMIMKQFQIQEELPKEQWRFGYGRHFYHYPSRFSFMYDYCYYKNWISELNGSLIVTEYVKQLDKMTPTALMKDVVRFWIKLYKRPIPQLPFLFSFVKESLTPGKAISANVLVETLLPCVKEYYFDSREDIIKKRLINMLKVLEVIAVEDLCSEQYITTGKAYSMVID